MKYRDLIQFEPINEVVKFDRLQENDYRRSLVSDFVFSEAYEKNIIPTLCKNLDYTASYDTYGLQIVGNYGTGKSHLMSLFSLVAEDEQYLEFVKSDTARQVLRNIAGKYKVVRFELGSNDELWRIVCHQIDLQLEKWGVDYSIEKDDKPDMYTDKLNRMMAQFEETFQGKGLMIVIDEMLSYLKGRSGSADLNRDLAVLQAFGQMSDHSKFRMVFGVQEHIYKAPEFQFAANMLQKVNDRFRQIEITKQDVQFVVQQRLLHKNDAQKDIIRKHLSKFTQYFSDIHANLENYVNLFPVNPSFFENFQQIKIGKSQREVMKTLTRKFESLLDVDVPETNPGLICYDSYWEDLQVSDMQTNPDIRRVTEIMDIVHQKIDENFTAARAKKAPLAHRIANACAVKILQDSLEKTNGVSAENLVDDLCYVDATCLSREFLLDTINTVANQIVTATVGQYFEKNDNNQEFHLRIEGGVNYEQKIKDFVATMSDDNKDSHFFNFLVEYLPIETEQYRREFKIFCHRIEWKSHKIMLDGYIFMGNPNERSTTQPQQNFYIYFMPIFNKAKMKHDDEPDSVYVHLDKISQEMKDYVELYASTEALIASVDSSQKPFYEEYKKRYTDKLKALFQRDFMQCTEIVYQGEAQPVTPDKMNGGSKEQIISNIASTLLEDYFCQQLPNYPKFTLLRAPLTEVNRVNILKGARRKIANPATVNSDGDAILAGLSLLQDNQLSVDACQYAISIKEKLHNKGEGQVLNRDEILHRFFKEWDNEWRSNDFDIDSEYEFLVLAAMVAMGEIEIDYPGGVSINATNLADIENFAHDKTYTFSHIRAPKGMNVAAVRELFLGITGKDMTAQLQNLEIYAELLSNAKTIAADAVELGHKVANGIELQGHEILSPSEGLKLNNDFKALAGMCDKLQAYATPTKMRNLPWPTNEIKEKCALIRKKDEIKKKLSIVSEFSSRFSYLNQAKQYMTSEEMKQSVDSAIQKINGVIAEMNDEQKVSAYKAELDAIMSNYADWYLSEYNRLHITAIQNAEKNKLLNSNEKKVCETICRADQSNGYFSMATQYSEWERKIQSLTMSSPNVNKDAVLRVPYQGFNPMSFVGKQLPDLGDLKVELEAIYANAEETLHVILRDEDLLKNKEILDDSEQGLLNRFNNGDEELSPTNAERLVSIVGKLHQGINKITIGVDDIRRNVFNRPMTPNEALKAFRGYIDQLTNGSKADNVRIIFK
ncbi:MAG: hypothetical protein E7069_03750 [Bacteroidales bacterium]|jgi:hypothetical protein|nr:hypothetical protein [Bacteroidales bacterium]